MAVGVDFFSRMKRHWSPISYPILFFKLWATSKMKVISLILRLGHVANLTIAFSMRLTFSVISIEQAIYI